MLDEVYLGGYSCPDFPLSDKKKRRQNGDKDNTEKKKEKHKKKIHSFIIEFCKSEREFGEGRGFARLSILTYVRYTRIIIFVPQHF